MKITYGFSDSPVMRELERNEISKNGTGEKPIEKKASEEPTDIMSKLVAFSKSLRKSGRADAADKLDYKIALYVAAEATHIYQAFDENGDDLIEFAHPDGDVEVAPSSNGYGKVETQISQHKKIVDIVQGNKSSTAETLNDIANILKVGQVSFLEEGKKDIMTGSAYLHQPKYGKLYFGIYGGKIVYYWDSHPDVRPIIGRAKSENVVVYATSSKNIKDIKVGDENALKAFKAFCPNYDELEQKWKQSQSFTSWLDVWKEAVDSANRNLQLAADNIQGQTDLVTKVVSNPNEQTYQSSKAIFDKINSGVWLLHALVGYNQPSVGRINEGVALIGSGLEKIKKSLETQTSSSLDIINKKLNELSEAQKAKGNIKPVVNITNITQLQSTFGTSDINLIIKKLDELIGQWKNASAKNINKKAQEIAPPPSKPAPTTSPVVKPQAQRKFDIEKWRESVRAWQSSVDADYWKSVEALQKNLHSLISLVPSIQNKVSDENKGKASLLSTDLAGTGITDARGLFDSDGKWGTGTVKALEAAKQILSMLDPEKAKNIKTGAEYKSGKYSGYLIYATDADKQKQVAQIAKDNIKLISDILREAGVSSISETTTISSEYDKVPRNIRMDSPEWLSTIDDNGFVLVGSDLQTISSFESWLIGNYNMDTASVPINNLRTIINRFIERAQTLLSESDSDKGTLQSYLDALRKLLKMVIDGFRAWVAANPGATSIPTGADLENALRGTSYPSARSERSGKSPSGEGIDVEGLGDDKTKKRASVLPFKDILYMDFLKEYFYNQFPASFVNEFKRVINIRDLSNTSKPEDIFIINEPVDFIQKLEYLGVNPNNKVMEPYGNGLWRPLVMNGKQLSFGELTPGIPLYSRFEALYRLNKLTKELPRLSNALNAAFNEWAEDVLEYNPDWKRYQEAGASHLRKWQEVIRNLENAATKRYQTLVRGG